MAWIGKTSTGIGGGRFWGSIPEFAWTDWENHEKLSQNNRSKNEILTQDLPNHESGVLPTRTWRLVYAGFSQSPPLFRRRKIVGKGAAFLLALSIKLSMSRCFTNCRFSSVSSLPSAECKASALNSRYFVRRCKLSCLKLIIHRSCYQNVLSVA
jgi:hypothetical protein